MAEQLTKLRPDRDLQCYFQQPSAVAALSNTSATQFTISGTWRQQFDWAVVEWNRDNTFEHPALRNLPDGDLSGLHLSYQETRTNCIPIDSTLYRTVDWPYLRIWVDSGATESLYRVPLIGHATPVGSYAAATVTFELQGTITGADYIELAWLDQHFNYWVLGNDTLAKAAAGLAEVIEQNKATGQVSATANGSTITLTWLGAPGSNGNRIGVYGTVHGACTESWAPGWAEFSHGASPATWQVDLDFGNLQGYLDPDFTTLVNISTASLRNVRNMRWTWAADLQAASFTRSEFSVLMSNWSVTGGGLTYQVAGPGGRRIEDDSAEISWHGGWTTERGNYSGGSIHHSVTKGDSAVCTYQAPIAHTLYLGTRYVGPITAAQSSLNYQVTAQVDGSAPVVINLKRPTEDVLIRYPLGQFAGQAAHTVTVTNTGDSGSDIYFDFLEIAVPTENLPSFPANATTTLATDWDTEHSQAIAPERTAWLMQKLGFQGRANHYAGALWFYELTQAGQQYATATISFSGTPEFGKTTTVSLGGAAITHQNLIGDTAASIATCFALLLNSGWTTVWAAAQGATLTITARTMGSAGNGLTISADTAGSKVFSAQVSGPLTGGVDGKWITDVNVAPRINRAARDWTRSFLVALKGYGINATAAFSMELGNGDDSTSAGLAQRYPDGTPVWVNTPALQTNFSPASLAFWQQAYLDMANVMASANVAPYLQFGEVQWWYFAGAAGMTFYDAYTTSTFQATYGRPMATIASQNADLAALTDECVFLPELIGQFTSAIMSFVRQTHPETQFEVLYPPDTNDTPLNRMVNYPATAWTAATLACLKTENLTYTGNRNLDQARQSILLPGQLGFPPSQRSHLVGIGDATTPWAKERRLAVAAGVESVVLFALDQFCLIGYDAPLPDGPRRALFMGA